MLSSFVANPRAYHFSTQHDGESIEYLLRRHWWTNVKWMLLSAFLLILPVIFANFSQLFTFWDIFSSDLKIVLLLVWYFVAAFFVFEHFLLWYYNAFLITDERVLDLDFYGFFHMESSEARLEQIQDVSHTQGGLSQLIFNFGNVYVQTASELGKIEILGVANPAKVHKILIDLKEKEENSPPQL